MRRLLLALAWLSAAPAVCAGSFALSPNCPPSFQLLPDGNCELVTLYALYESAPQHGGLRARITPPAAHFRPQEMDLGRYLFFDPVLSAGRDMSCATCHDPALGFRDGRRRAFGRAELDRRTPGLWNVALNDRFMWDGRAASLPAQALLPLTNSREMGGTPAGIVAAVAASPAYRRLFQKVYGRTVDIGGITSAIAAFESTLISLNSRYDRYAHGDASALTPQEIRGHNLFRGFVARCSQCHVPPLFTDNELAVVGAPADDRGRFDPGAGALAPDAGLQGAFKVPTLRNASVAGPYFNAGQFASLHDVVSFYNDTRGHAEPPGARLHIHWHIHMSHGPELSAADVDDIVAFLGSLRDETLMPAIPRVVPSGLVPAIGRKHAATGMDAQAAADICKSSTTMRCP